MGNFLKYPKHSKNMYSTIIVEHINELRYFFKMEYPQPLHQRCIRRFIKLIIGSALLQIHDRVSFIIKIIEIFCSHLHSKVLGNSFALY
jgi:hypothetical protein